MEGKLGVSLRDIRVKTQRGKPFVPEKKACPAQGGEHSVYRKEKEEQLLFGNEPIFFTADRRRSRMKTKKQSGV